MRFTQQLKTFYVLVDDGPLLVKAYNIDIVQKYLETKYTFIKDLRLAFDFEVRDFKSFGMVEIKK